MRAPDPTRTATAPRQPSLRRRLLAYVLLPALLFTIGATALLYVVALHYSNKVHDRDLAYSVLGLADALADGPSNGRLNDEARALLEFNPEGRTFYSVRSERHGLVAGSAPQLRPGRALVRGERPVLYDAIVGGLPVRATSLRMTSPTDPADELVVSMAETLHDRQLAAREILALTIPLEALLLVVLLALMWHGVGFGLRILDAPIRQLASSEDTLAPLSGEEIPVEILPLTRAIDALFGRVQALLALQERFVADAAHQLRTPLAGLAMHAERARAATSAEERQASLAHLQALVARMTRSTTQLLSLARAQAPLPASAAPVRSDLADELPALLAARVPEALEAGIDLGYEASGREAPVRLQPGALHELLDNLVDNALRHTPRGGVVTVGLHADDDTRVDLSVDDSGPGVDEALLPRLGERFFRAPDAPPGGSGLGLAIVRRIADTHGATLAFGRSALGGLRVDVGFVRAGQPA